MEKRGVRGHEVAMSDLRDFCARRQIRSRDLDLISYHFHVFEHE
jgi:hypothetical protein